MAANDYYRDSSTERYYSPSNQNLLNASQTSYEPYTRLTPSSTLSYHDLRPTVSKEPESTPVQTAPKLDTRSDRRHRQATQYPSSPEGNVITPLVSGSQPKQKNKFFSRKTTWVVYILSIIQISVFLYEIIKNPKFSNILADLHRGPTTSRRLHRFTY